MELLQKVLECSEEEVDSIIERAVDDANKNAIPVEKLGFLDYEIEKSIFKGFIPLKTRIKYANFNLEDYGMETTDFLYEFAHFIKKNQINHKGAFIYSLEYFINQYFGYPGQVERETIFHDIAWQTTTTDEDFFKALRDNKIGDLKGKGAAQCTERSALAQQILSLFGIESYYCMGCVDWSDKQEAHCFNIVKRKNDYALLDYSIPVTSYHTDGSMKAFCPFIGTLTNEEFVDFIQNGMIKFFDDYYLKDGKFEKNHSQRFYVVGKYEIEKEEIISKV